MLTRALASVTQHRHRSHRRRLRLPRARRRVQRRGAVRPRCAAHRSRRRRRGRALAARAARPARRSRCSSVIPVSARPRSRRSSRAGSRELGARVHLGTVPAPGTGQARPTARSADLSVPRRRVRSCARSVMRCARRRARSPTAVILDDLHLADHDLLDALEYATLGGEPLPLWVLGVAGPRLDARRPQLGARAERRRRDVLPPLDEDAAVALDRRAAPARRVSAAARAAPARRHRARQPAAPRDARARDPPARRGPRARRRCVLPRHERARRALAGRARTVARRARARGARRRAGRARARVRRARRRGRARRAGRGRRGGRARAAARPRRSMSTSGWASSSRAGILAETDDGYEFRQPLVEEGVYATTNEDERLVAPSRGARALATGAIDSPAVAERDRAPCRGGRRPRRSRRARSRRSATHALREQRSLDADHAWSGALRHLPARDARSCARTVGRAQARYRLQRMRDALVDLEEAPRSRERDRRSASSRSRR